MESFKTETSENYRKEEVLVPVVQKEHDDDSRKRPTVDKIENMKDKCKSINWEKNDGEQEKMMVFLTEKSLQERSKNAKAIKFPSKVRSSSILHDVRKDLGSPVGDSNDHHLAFKSYFPFV